MGLDRVIRKATTNSKAIRVRRKIVEIEGYFTATDITKKRPITLFQSEKQSPLTGEGTIAEKKQLKADFLAGYINIHRSSVIDTVQYDAKTSTLTITFVSGGTYEYPNVPLSVLEQFSHAPSLGGYFTRVIRPFFGGFQ